jgi:hypothetical protein
MIHRIPPSKEHSKLISDVHLQQVTSIRQGTLHPKVVGQQVLPLYIKTKTEATNIWPLSVSPRVVIQDCHLADTACHLQLNQTVQLNSILHGELFGDRLDEAIDDQRIGLSFIQTTAHQIEELVITDL